MTEQTIAEMAPARIAFIIDGVVADVLNTDDRLAAIFLSQPKAVDVTEISQSEFITSGYLYNEELNTFEKFAVEEIPGPVTDTVAEGQEIDKDPSSTED
jgi:hypothetical protein